MIGANTHRTIELLALLDKRCERLDEEGALLEVVLVRLVNRVFKGLAAIDKVARVDADLLDGIGDRECDL